jgi:hypothetical protein
LGEGLILEEGYVEGRFPVDRGGVGLEEEAVSAGELESMELGASSSGGGDLICGTNLEAVKVDVKSQKNLGVIDVADLEEPFSFYKEPRFLVGIGDSITKEKFVNLIVEETLTDLIPSYK